MFTTDYDDILAHEAALERKLTCSICGELQWDHRFGDVWSHRFE